MHQRYRYASLPCVQKSFIILIFVAQLFRLPIKIIGIVIIFSSP